MAAAHLRMAGVPELIAHSDSEYVSIVLRLAHDTHWRQQLEQRLRALDLDAVFFANGEEREMVDAVRYLLDNHEQLRTEQPNNTPIVFARVQ